VLIWSAIGCWLALMAVGPYIGPWGPEQIDPNVNLSPPGGVHLFGTDNVGMDIFSRILAAPRINLLIALMATSLAVGIGVPLGAVAGYLTAKPGWRGFLSDLIMRLLDVIQAFPIFIFALALVAVLGPSTRNVILALTLAGVTLFTRLARADMLAVREMPYAEAARCLGHSDMRIIFRHLLPNALSASIAQVPVVIGFVILFTASLSFVGAGVPPPTPELGSMIAIGARNLITGQWWPALFPGIALGLMILSFALGALDIGQRLRAVKRGQDIASQVATPQEAFMTAITREL
jgi:peptide/nickel transport system permease protein